MREYELVMIVSPEVGEDGVSDICNRVTQFITDQGGSLINQDHWGVRRLAYPIQKFYEGNYILTGFNMEPNYASQLESTLRLTPTLLRHLLIREGS